MSSCGRTSKYPDCGPNLGTSELVLRIVPRARVPSWARETDLFGYAVVSEQDAFATVANVFFHRVEALAAEIRSLPARMVFSRAVILGHLMAHELGHLLLGANSHSRNGLMSLPWGREQLERTTQGKLLFTRRQAGRMRANVRARRVQESRRAASEQAAPR